MYFMCTGYAAKQKLNEMAKLTHKNLLTAKPKIFGGALTFSVLWPCVWDTFPVGVLLTHCFAGRGTAQFSLLSRNLHKNTHEHRF